MSFVKFHAKIFLITWQNDAETENIEVLTDQKFKDRKHCNYVIERNWEFIEGLKFSRFNYGMSNKPPIQNAKPAGAEDDENTGQPVTKRAKHIRFE